MCALLYASSACHKPEPKAIFNTIKAAEATYQNAVRFNAHQMAYLEAQNNEKLSIRNVLLELSLNVGVHI